MNLVLLICGKDEQIRLLMPRITELSNSYHCHIVIGRVSNYKFTIKEERQINEKLPKM